MSIKYDIDKKIKLDQDIQSYYRYIKNASYEDTNNDKSKGRLTRTNILKDLLKGQGYICAYCMSNINESNASIEHIIGQKYIDKKGNKIVDTVYDNILAVCNGKCCHNLHCDKSRTKVQAKRPLLFISPLCDLQMQKYHFFK